MQILINKAEEDARKAFDSYWAETKKAKAYYKKTVMMIEKDEAYNPPYIINEELINYNHMTFLMSWIRFEKYVKEVAIGLFRCKGDELLDPNYKSKSNGNGKRKVSSRCEAIQRGQISYAMLYLESQKFSNINSLKEYIFNSIAEQAGIGQADVSEYISLIKLFYPNAKPYDFKYIIDDEERECNFRLIDAIRRIRNTLIHDAGRIRTKDRETIKVYKSFEDSVYIDNNALQEIQIILDQVVNNINRIVTEGLTFDKEIAKFKSLSDEEKYFKNLLKQYLQEEKEIREQIQNLEGVLVEIEREIDEELQTIHEVEQNNMMYQEDDFPPVEDS